MCVSSASTDLCGGWWVTAIPTATRRASARRSRERQSAHQLALLFPSGSFAATHSRPKRGAQSFNCLSWRWRPRPRHDRKRAIITTIRKIPCKAPLVHIAKAGTLADFAFSVSCGMYVLSDARLQGGSQAHYFGSAFTPAPQGRHDFHGAIDEIAYCPGRLGQYMDGKGRVARPTFGSFRYGWHRKSLGHLMSTRPLGCNKSSAWSSDRGSNIHQ